MKVVVLDYGSGNVRSAVRALERVGAQVELTADATRSPRPTAWWSRAWVRTRT